MKEVEISHDGVARFSTLRVKGHSVDGCAWCGQTGRLWRYGTQSDGIGSRKAWDTKQFCSKNCRDTYYS